MQPVRLVTIIPANTPDLSQRQAYLNKSLARSHAAKLSHNRRRQQLLRKGSSISQPVCSSEVLLGEEQEPTPIDSGSCKSHAIFIQTLDSNPSPKPFPSTRHPGSRNSNWREGRSLQFFIVKTASEWVSWYDAEFWRVLTPQASSLHVCLRHGLVALGAYHESVEVGRTDPQRSRELKKYTTMHGQMAMSLLFKEHESLPASVKLSTYIVIAAITAFLEPNTYLQALILQHTFKEQLDYMRQFACSGISQSDWHFITSYLDPTLDRQRSKYAQVVDKHWAIRTAHSSCFHTNGPMHVPETFANLSHSRNILEKILKWTTFQLKTCTAVPNSALSAGDNLLQTWTAALNKYAHSNKLSQRDELTVRILRVAARISIILISTMNEEDEMAFDQYTSDFRELADVFIEASSWEKSRTHVNFGVETSLMALCAGPAVRWCRQPDIRRDFICSFRATDRHEGMEAAWIWAEVFDLTQKIEEHGIDPPPVSCNDIPLESRRRITSLSIYWKAYLIKVEYLRYPYRPSDGEEHWIPHPGWKTMFSSPPVTFDQHCFADMIYGQGSLSLLRPESLGEYYTIANPKYYFNLPRV